VKKGQELDWKRGYVEEVRMVDSNEKFWSLTWILKSSHS
jgi:hypothetical protein